MERVAIDAVHFGSQDGKSFEIEATTSTGRRYHFIQVLNDGEVARLLTDKIRRVGSIDPTLWNRGYNIYGSPAFESEEREAAAWAGRVREGHCSLDEVPASLKTLL
jgi:hypothetical protein